MIVARMAMTDYVIVVVVGCVRDARGVYRVVCVWWCIALVAAGLTCCGVRVMCEWLGGVVGLD